jgi:hypothetical protein
VPLFEVGQDGDTCYYDMQFIPRQNLDQILIELRRLPGRPPSETSPTQVEDAARSEFDQLAHSLLTGRFQVDRAAATAIACAEAHDAAANGDTLSGGRAADTASSAVPPGQADLSSVRSDRPH